MTDTGLSRAASRRAVPPHRATSRPGVPSRPACGACREPIRRRAWLHIRGVSPRESLPPARRNRRLSLSGSRAAGKENAPGASGIRRHRGHRAVQGWPLGLLASEDVLAMILKAGAVEMVLGIDVQATFQ